MWDLGPCLTTAIWRCRKNSSQWQLSFQWKLDSHWLKFLRQRHVTIVRQGPGPAIKLGRFLHIHFTCWLCEIHDWLGSQIRFYINISIWGSQFFFLLTFTFYFSLFLFFSGGAYFIIIIFLVQSKPRAYTFKLSFWFYYPFYFVYFIFGFLYFVIWPSNLSTKWANGDHKSFTHDHFAAERVASSLWPAELNG